MKKLWIALLSFILLFGFASQTFAELAPSRIALGVQLGAKLEQVKNVFGEPGRIIKQKVKYVK